MSRVIKHSGTNCGMLCSSLCCVGVASLRDVTWSYSMTRTAASNDLSQLASGAKNLLPAVSTTAAAGLQRVILIMGKTLPDLV